MCDCHKKIAEKLTEMTEAKVKNAVGFQKIISSYFETQSFIIRDGEMVSVPFCLPFIVKYERKTKSTGKILVCKEPVKFVPPYCPICGQKYDRTSPPKQL